MTLTEQDQVRLLRIKRNLPNVHAEDVEWLIQLIDENNPKLTEGKNANHTELQNN